ncbi:MAG: prolyl oligopeptidase family serine peptidase [Candidatus Shapirobacteria bacterium]|nr:prolyl oligopeptidase family serine peptidase [Candidatus Shapirobacteria bacterium]
MKKIFLIIIILLIFGLVGVGIGKVYDNKNNWLSPKGSSWELFKTNDENKVETGDIKIEKNIGYLAQYNFENLRKRENKGSIIKDVGKVLVVEEARPTVIEKYKEEGILKENNFTSKAISFESNGKKISGMINLPADSPAVLAGRPAIIMIRGFAESEGYFVGSGSWKVADELARNGFVTISLDFLGFGLSDDESKDILEARFEKPVGVLDLIESVKKLKYVDPDRIGIWAHSNGGQIAVSVLEITGKNYPTVLWAPMTNPFPMSILETMDDSEGGLIVKKRIEDFEKEYDSELYSIYNYYNWIEAPILIHQGTSDVWCQVKWQENFKKQLEKYNKEVYLDIREGSDHNLKESWNEVIKMDIEFYKNKMKI